MNVIWESLSRSAYVEMAEKICKDFDIKNLYVFQTDWSKKIIDNTPLIRFIRERFNQSDMIVANYNGYIWFDKMEPLDKELLDAMAPYEPEALKMLERVHGNKNPAELRFMQYHQHLRYWNTFLNKADIDVVIFAAPPHAWFDYILMRLCQLKKIPTIMEEYFPFQGVISDTRHRLVAHYEKFDEDIIDRINKYKGIYTKAEEVILPDDIQEDYDRFMHSEKQIFSIDMEPDHPILDRVDYFKRLFRENKGYAFQRTIDHYKNRSRTKKLIKQYESIAVHADYKKKYIYFPLHYQPEMSTCPLGGWFVHQYLAVEMLSYYVPEDVLVYVREHPTMKVLPANVQIYEHYERMAKLRNVVLISMDDDSQALITHSLAVSSITGSVGFEALFKKKPYIMFGYGVMRYGPGTLNVRYRDDCKAAIEKIMAGQIQFNELDIKILLKVFGDITTKFELKSLEESDQKTKETNIGRLYKMYSDAILQSLRQGA